MNRVALGLFVLFTVALAGCGGDTPFNPKIGTIPTTTATAITRITFTANSVQGGQPITGTIVLNGVAGTGGAVVNLTSNNALAVVPASFTIPAGQSSGTFQVTTSAVTTNTTVVITATFNGSTQTFTLTLTPASSSGTPSVSAITFVLAGGIGGQTATGTITLSSAAPTGGTVVTLTSDNAAAAVPATVTVPAGSTSTTFTVTTSTVSANTLVTITANTAGGTAKTFVFTVVPSGPAVSLLSSTTCTNGQPPITVDLIITPPANTITYSGSDNLGNAKDSTVTINGSFTSSQVSYDATNHNVNFFFLDGTARTISYTITPPASANGSATLMGSVAFGISANGSTTTDTEPITGMRTITCTAVTGATGTTGVR